MCVSALVLAALPVFDFATNSIAQRIAGADPAVCLSRFTDYPNCFKKSSPDPQSRIPNTSFWLKDVDFSCASPWNDECGMVRAGTLISKRHIIFAKHFPLWKGCRVLFVDREGEVCPCRVEETRQVGKTDIMIGSLDYEVTPSIHPAKILPEDFAKHIGDGTGLPIVTFNRQEKVFLSECRGMTSNSVSNSASTRSSWKALGGKIVVGDSGNPAFLLVGNEPILLYCLFSGGAGHGPSVFRYRKEIQKMMDELCPGYTLEVYDFASKRVHLQGFPAFTSGIHK